MEYRVEDLSSVKKQVHISVDSKEVEAAIMGTVALYRTSVQIDGFRKGKVPLSVIESRFRDKIYAEAKQDLVNVHINKVMTDLNLSPVSGINFDGKDLVRNEDFSYIIDFEVLPDFDIPNYEGLEVQQEKIVVNDAEIDEFVERLRKDKSKLEVAEGNGPAVDGQVVEIDFAAFENGEPCEGISAQNFQMPLGEKQALEAFESLVKTVKLGETKEGEVAFPEDFLAPDLAGKNLTMKVTVNSIKNRELPEVNDEFAKSFGQNSVEELRNAFVEQYIKSRESLQKGTAQKSLLDRLLKMVEFELPPTMIDLQLRSLIASKQQQALKQGRSLESMGLDIDKLSEQLLKEAEDIARAQVFLLSVAKKEELSVQEQEIDYNIYQMAMQTGQDFKQLKDDYVNSDTIFLLRDRLLADKAIDVIYTKAVVNEVEPAGDKEEATA